MFQKRGAESNSSGNLVVGIEKLRGEVLSRIRVEKGIRTDRADKAPEAEIREDVGRINVNRLRSNVLGRSLNRDRRLRLGRRAAKRFGILGQNDGRLAR